MPGSSWVGQQIDDRLPLHEWLGSTGPRDVFRTELPEGRQAAILLVSADDESAPALLGNWQAAAALNHPHLLRIFECGRTYIEASEVVYAVTELPEEALGQILPERPLSADEVREMLPPILDALAHIHGNGLVHTSIEPANILVVGEHLKLSTYSLQSAGSTRATDEPAQIHNAPETAGGGPLTPAADVWSLGITVIEALTQHSPTWLRSSGRDPLVPATVPQPFAEIARRCLHINPAQRCTLSEIRGLLSTPPAAPVVKEPAAKATPAASPASAQLPLPYEGAPATQLLPESEAPRFRKSLHAIEDSGPAPRFPLAIVIGGAALLLLLIAGIVAYSHRGNNPLSPADRAGDQAKDHAANSSTLPPAKPVKPPAQSSGPSVKGEVAQRVVPEVPAHAASGIHGKVDVRIKLAVDHSGNVTNASILSEGHSRYFANQALDAARKWRFRPARMHGQPAPSTWELRFVFRQNGTEVTPLELTP